LRTFGTPSSTRQGALFGWTNTDFIAQAKDVSKGKFEQFWEWFGKVLHKIRHQKPVPEMWEKVILFVFFVCFEASFRDSFLGLLAREQLKTFCQTARSALFLFASGECFLNSFSLFNF
jgi:hypothetical protein